MHRTPKWQARMIVVLLLALLSSCGEQLPVGNQFAEGKPLPLLRLTDLNGAAVSSRSFEGKLLVLNVWGSWCPPCRKEMPGLQRLSERLDARLFAVAGLSVDRDVMRVSEFVGRYGITFENFVDPGGRLAKKLGVDAYPETLLLAPDGTLIRRVQGEQDWNSPETVRMLEALQRGYQIATHEHQADRQERK
ncbi:MAG: TlpA disulfide reductase family protein [Sideroxyarcus sp.]|nr:TlpA disulfide reductase family protein [Sideroxyarcus sp.]